MKRSVLALQFLFWLLVAGAQRDTADYPCLRLVNGKVPFFETTTIDGKKIDSSYFSGKITILAFFGFGCGPCYSELRLLDEISKTKPRDQYQVILVGDATEKDLRELRASHSRKYKRIKRKMGIDSLAFDLVADCPDNPVKLIHRGCAGSGQIFKVTATPTTFFINRGSVISDVCIGFSMRRDSIWDAYFYSKLKNAEN